MDTLHIPFPTHSGPVGRGRGGGLGFPDRAKPGDGHRCVIHDDECMWCGRLPASVIDQTWRERMLAVDRAARAPAPFWRFIYQLAEGRALV